MICFLTFGNNGSTDVPVVPATILLSELIFYPKNNTKSVCCGIYCLDFVQSNSESFRHTNLLTNMLAICLKLF